MNASFEYTTTLEYRLKAANAQIRAFKSGEIYVRMQEEYLKERSSFRYSSCMRTRSEEHTSELQSP